MRVRKAARMKKPEKLCSARSNSPQVVLGLLEVWWLEVCYGGKLYEYRNNIHPQAVNAWSYVRVSYPYKGSANQPRMKQLVAGAFLLGAPIQRGQPGEEDVFRPEWGSGDYAQAYPVLGVRIFDNTFDLGYGNVLGSAHSAGMPMRDWLPGLVLHANREFTRAGPSHRLNLCP